MAESVNAEMPDEDRLDEPQTQFSEDEQASDAPEIDEELVDEEIDESFPASDPPANY